MIFKVSGDHDEERGESGGGGGRDDDEVGLTHHSHSGSGSSPCHVRHHHKAGLQGGSGQGMR